MDFMLNLICYLMLLIFRPNQPVYEIGASILLLYSLDIFYHCSNLDQPGAIVSTKLSYDQSPLLSGP